MNIRQYIEEICQEIDAVRADLWETAGLANVRMPTDNHSRIANRQSARAEIWGAVMDYREERMSFSELLMSLQAFDPSVTPDHVFRLLGRHYHGE